MRQLLLKPYTFFFLAGVIALLVGFLISQGTIDLHLHDTYVVISNRVYFIAMAVLAGFLGALYALCAPAFISRFLTWVHTIVTIVCILSLVGITFLMPANGTSDNSWSNFEQFVAYNKWVTIIAMALIFIQVVFLVNLIAGIIKHYKK